MTRYEKGLKKLEEVCGEAGLDVVKSLQSVCPDLAQYTVEFPYGDVHSRPGLDAKSREISIVSSLIALGYAGPQLKVHILAALNVGCSETEIKEIIILMTVYAGFPAALNAMMVAKEAFAEHKAS